MTYDKLEKKVAAITPAQLRAFVIDVYDILYYSDTDDAYSSELAWSADELEQIAEQLDRYVTRPD